MNKFLVFIVGAVMATIIQLSLNEVSLWVKIPIISIIFGAVYMMSEPFEEKNE